MTEHVVPVAAEALMRLLAGGSRSAVIDFILGVAKTEGLAWGERFLDDQVRAGMEHWPVDALIKDFGIALYLKRLVESRRPLPASNQFLNWLVETALRGVRLAADAKA